MKTIKQPTSSLRARNSGFTLVEMAVVMVIIGVILGAVMIGRDTQKNAEYLRIKQTFVNQWALAYNAYTQRYGVVPGDSTDTPTLAVNGRSIGGQTPNANNRPGQLCERDGVANATQDMRALFQQAGVELPRGRGRTFEDRYTYLDSNGNPVEMRVCFLWNPPNTASGPGNVMVISGLTPDLARSLDTSIDGVVHAGRGSFRLAGVASADTTDWGANNTNTQGQQGVDVTGDRAVALLTAHYKMNQ